MRLSCLVARPRLFRWTPSILLLQAFVRLPSFLPDMTPELIEIHAVVLKQKYGVPEIALVSRPNKL